MRIVGFLLVVVGGAGWFDPDVLPMFPTLAVMAFSLIAEIGGSVMFVLGKEGEKR